MTGRPRHLHRGWTGPKFEPTENDLSGRTRRWVAIVDRRLGRVDPDYDDVNPDAAANAETTRDARDGPRRRRPAR